MFRLDHSQCSDKILTAIAENKIQFDAMDATKGLMTFESSYANFKEGLGDFNPDCNRFRRGLYLQVFFIKPNNHFKQVNVRPSNYIYSLYDIDHIIWFITTLVFGQRCFYRDANVFPSHGIKTLDPWQIENMIRPVHFSFFSFSETVTFSKMAMTIL